MSEDGVVHLGPATADNKRGDYIARARVMKPYSIPRDAEVIETIKWAANHHKTDAHTNANNQLLDTIFLALKHKNMGTNMVDSTGVQWVVIFLNLFVHTIMYWLCDGSVKSQNAMEKDLSNPAICYRFNCLFYMAMQ
eukprot:151081_1